LLPVFFGRRWIPKRNRVPAPGAASLVALCGVLPDVLSPHLYLDSRHTALSHTLWAFAVFAAAALLLRRFRPALLPAPLALLCICAYGGHILCDYLTGGVAFLYPCSTKISGKNHLPYWLWITCDGLLILYFYMIYRWIPLRRRFLDKKRLSLPPV
jgi:membrane-bound metal-dependent hydrolase YbcI (DUF457 family)